MVARKDLPYAKKGTTTGAVMEAMVLPALEQGGYEYFRQVVIGERLGGGKHIVDLVAYNAEGRGYLVSMKWQQTSGTAEQKVPYEAMCLIEAALSDPGRYAKAYLVLGGPAWTLRDFYTDGGLWEYMRHDELLSIITLEAFVARANRGEL
ncbi:MAG TPA: PD-(D/E)XK nuclease superfamily protein [Dehalococcoidia bacterium]|nr:PD-(D/E)XK nuclease superfamily protein [Dehalococcoidia bacterium]